MMNVYCISGLGADERVFRNLHLPGTNLVHLGWPKHIDTDTMASYAAKLSELTPVDKPIILGVSFGGMLAVEIAKQRPVKKIILISSAEDMHERPLFPLWIRKIVLWGLIPAFVFKIPNPILYYLFGTDAKHDDRMLLRNVILDSNARLLKWASKAILLWDNSIIPRNVVHIHGRKDRMILPENIQADYWIEDGGHMMIYNRAEQVSKILNEEFVKL